MKTPRSKLRGIRPIAIDDEHVALAITSQMAVIACLNEQIRQLEQGIKGQVKPEGQPVSVLD